MARTKARRRAAGEDGREYAVSGPCGDLLPVERFTLTRSRRA
ncbi:hypothetical protein [Streptomyces sp. B3I8]|jgi:hypothetical protein|nr:hypothetical protein [Streptomyces sp. B3I8]MDQ0784906.1 hypothetical protein [Streptomyces sp. B3I8]